MTCDCIKQVNENLRKATGDPEARLNVEYELPNLIQRVYVNFTYRKKKRDGSFGKEIEGHLSLGKCPFCGKPQK